MRYGALLAMVGALVWACGISADDKTDKPEVKKETAAKGEKPADQPVKKPAADAPTKKPLAAEDKQKAKKEGAPQAAGKLEAASVAGNVLTLTIDGKEYEIPIATTKAM